MVEAYFLAWTYPVGRARPYGTASYKQTDGTWKKLYKEYGEVPKARLLRAIVEHFTGASQVCDGVITALLKQPGTDYMRIEPDELRQRLSEAGIRIILCETI